MLHRNRFNHTGSFLEFQRAMQLGWMTSLNSQKPKVLTPEYLERARRKHFCVECLQNRGFLIKMDYRPLKEKWSYSTYEIDAWVCPACKKQDRSFQKVAGRGKSGKDSF